MFFVKTGNHHLFIVAEPWIILLGKRKPHFPFFGTRFENATFYNLVEQKLYHHAAEEMCDLVFEKTDECWHVLGKTPMTFSLRLRPILLFKRDAFFKRIAFQYHALTLLSGEIGSETLGAGHGVSEEGTLFILPWKRWQVPFHYTLWLEAAGQGGEIAWRADPQLTPRPLRFLGDRFCWGGFSSPGAEETLAATNVPLRNWILKRKIVRSKESGRICYGLKESFDLKNS